MCIQDNPRYINLVEMGMPDSIDVIYLSEKGNHKVSWGVFESSSFRSPEKAFALLFDMLEKYYAPHQ